MLDQIDRKKCKLFGNLASNNDHSKPQTLEEIKSLISSMRPKSELKVLVPNNSHVFSYIICNY